jgi:hypothetical protein
MVSRDLLHVFNKIFQIQWVLLCGYLVLTGWGQLKVQEDPVQEFETLSAQFETYGKIYKSPDYKLPPMKINLANITQSIYNGFNSRETNTIGICLPDNKGGKHILIDRKFWSEASYQEKELLIFHELGHCVLNRGHDSRMFCDNTDYSIMNPILMLGYEYQKNKEHYLQDLFQSTYQDNFVDILTNKADLISCVPVVKTI